MKRRHFGGGSVSFRDSLWLPPQREGALAGVLAGLFSFFSPW